MRITLPNMRRFQEVNQLPLIANPVFFDAGLAPTRDGLLSTELLGRYGSYKRRNLPAMLPLGRRYPHPVVWRTMTALDPRVSAIAGGQGSWVVSPSGALQEAEGGGTGLAWLEENWKKIVWRRTGSAGRDDKIELLRLHETEEAWPDLWPVIPAALRDVNLDRLSEGSVSVGEINELYARLLRLTQAADPRGTGVSLAGDQSALRAIGCLCDIYDFFMGDGGRVPKKGGILHRGVLGKAVDYACRSVISAARVSAERPEDMPVTFEKTGMPLAQVCVLLIPLVIHEVQRVLEDEVAPTGLIETKDGEKIRVKDVLEQFSPTEIRRMVELYIKSPGNRFDPVELEAEDGRRVRLWIWARELGRPLTLTDLLYVAAHRAAEGKHAYVTRYPVEHHQNIHPTGIHILTTRRTVRMELGGRLFPTYPLVYEDYPDPESEFVDTVQMSSSYLEALNGDYDGRNLR